MPFPVPDLRLGKFGVRLDLPASALAARVQTVPGSSDPFRQSNEFYYLCGIVKPHAYLLLDGRVVLEGTSDHLTNDPVARRHYLGENFRM